MKKTINAILSVLLLLMGISSASAKTAFFSSMYMTGQPSGTSGSTVANNVWYGNGTNLDAGNVIQITGNKGKGLTKQSTITIGETSYDAFKNSNGAQLTITLPSGRTAYSVDFYATANGATDATLGEFEGTTCSDVINSHQNGAKPTKISKTLATPATSFTFTFKSTQVFFVAVVHYLEASDKPEFLVNPDETITARQGVEIPFTVQAIGATSYQWYKASSTTADPTNDTVIEGATSATYNYISSSSDTEYIYCTATNTNGTSISSVCTIAKRTFTDFGVDFRVKNGDVNYTVVKPTSGELPSGVVINATTYNGSQHGVQKPTLTIPVDGPVKFTVGACQFSNSNIKVTPTEGTATTFSNNASCGEQNPNYNQYVVYTYNNETPTTLTFAFEGDGYMPYFFAEATDFVPSCEVTYYDVDGNTILKTETVEGNSELVYNAEATAAVTVADGKKFRGWFNDKTIDATKVAEGTAVSADLKLYAKATEIETVEVGKIFKYDLTKPYFYEEDHEAFTNNGGSFHDGQHGWSWGKNKSFSIPVAGNAQIVLGLCMHSADAAITVTAANETEVDDIASAKVSSDGATATVNYTGEATTLTFTFGNSGTTYVHNVTVYNVESIPTKDATTGYYMVGAGDGAGFILALNAANSEDGAKIFLPNGTYDLGETVLTTVSGNNMSIIGESMEGVIIKNSPDKSLEGLNTVGTLVNSSNNLYMQDITLQNELDYYGAGSAGRANAFWDKGNKTICKNVRLLSYQDTYLSAADKQFYWEDGEIHGTVDYICGGGDVYFNRVKLVNEVRKYDKDNKPTGECTITAHQPKNNENFGYVFNGCTIEALGAEDGSVSFNLGRAWGGASGATVRPQATYLNTTINQPDNIISTRFTTTGMNNQYGIFHEYNSMNTSGAVVSPASNIQKFTDKTNTESDTYETILTAAEAANYALDKVFTDWTPNANTVQASAPKATIENGVITIVPADGGDAGVYLIEKNGEFFKLTSDLEVVVEENQPESFGNDVTELAPVYTVRASNAMGGFGEPAEVSQETAVEIIEAAPEAKAAEGAFVIGDKVVIIKDGKQFTAAGARIK